MGTRSLMDQAACRYTARFVALACALALAACGVEDDGGGGTATDVAGADSDIASGDATGLDGGADAGVDAAPTCGDGIAEGEELCDGDDLRGATCASRGLADGTLQCDAACELDESGCGAPAVCGDGVVAGDEECDGDDLGGATCEDLELGEGALACSEDCTIDSSGCASPPECGDGVVEGDEECDGAVPGGTTCGTLGLGFGAVTCDERCRFVTIECGDETVCGDGVAEGAEECDDGNLDSGDGCSAECRAEECGDRVLQPELGEECEPGMAEVVACDGGDTGVRRCLDDCTFSAPACPDPGACGDGTIDPGEACDDGNEESGDGCDSECQSETCGDGVRSDFERCDGDALGGLTCDDFGFGAGVLACTDACELSFASCRSALCGDGHVDGGEECDDGGNEPGDGCSSDCRLESCGDGIVQAAESCDDGDANSDEEPDACRTDCTLPACGDGVVDSTETCDDGAANSDEEPDACRTDCSLPMCGDSVVDEGEACDDGGTENGDLCSATCEVELRPLPDFERTPAVGVAPLEVSFDASGSEDPDGTIVGYAWDFGDGATGSGVTTTHTYESAGEFSVSLTVEDDDGHLASVLATVTVREAIPPTIEASAVRTTACAGETELSLSATASDSDGTVESVVWTVGGETIGTGVSILHVFPEPGAITVTVTATDDDGATASDVVEITVLDAPDLGVRWVGGEPGAEDDWSQAGNWCGGGPPTEVDAVHVPAGVADTPELVESATIASLEIDREATLTLPTFAIVLTITGDAAVAGAIEGEGIVSLAGGGAELFGDFPNLIIESERTATGDVFAMQIRVEGEGASLDVGPHQVVARESLVVRSGGALVMNDASGEVGSEGTLDLAMDSTAAEEISAGTIRLSGGSFDCAGAGGRFAVGGSHMLVFDSGGITDVDFSSNDCEFHDVRIEGGTTVNFESVAAFSGTIDIADGAVTADGGLVEVVLSGGLIDETGAAFSPGKLRLIRTPTTFPIRLATDLVIEGDVTLADGVAVDGALTVDSESRLSLGANTVAVAGDLLVNGGVIGMTDPSAVLDIEGRAEFRESTDDPATKSAGTIRAASDFVCAFGNFVPGDALLLELDGEASQTVRMSGGTCELADLVVDNEAGVVFGTSATIRGDVEVRAGDVTSTSTITTVTIGGDLIDDVGDRFRPGRTTFSGAPALPSLITSDVAFAGDFALGGDLRVDGDLTVSSSTVELGPHELRVTGDLLTNGANLRMTDVDGVLDVEGTTEFRSSSDDPADLSAGTVRSAGDFRCNFGSFVAGGSHRVVLDGTGEQRVSASSGSCRFATLEVAGGTGVLQTSAEVAADVVMTSGSLGSESAITTLTIEGDLIDPAGLYAVGRTVFSGTPTLPESIDSDVTIEGTVLLDHPLDILGSLLLVRDGLVDVGDQRLRVDGDLTENGGILRMTDAAGVVSVGGDSLFEGSAPSRTDRTAGVLELEGDFTCLVSRAGEFFHSPAGHTLRFAGAAEQDASLDCGGGQLGTVVVAGGANVRFSPSPTPGDGQDAIAGSLTIDTGGECSVEAGQSLAIAGDLNVLGTLDNQGSISYGGTLDDSGTITGNEPVADP